MVKLPARIYILASSSSLAELFNNDEDTPHNTDFDPNMLTEEGYYTICCVIMHPAFILKSRAAD
jgi:hypothetical protein